MAKRWARKRVVQTQLDPKDYRALVKFAKTQGLTVKEALRRAVLLLVFQEFGIDPRDPIFDIGLRRRKATRNVDLFHQACTPTGVSSRELAQELKKGRSLDRKREQDLERRYS